jgi:hypothetical protein
VVPKKKDEPVAVGLDGQVAYIQHSSQDLRSNIPSEQSRPQCTLHDPGLTIWEVFASGLNETTNPNIAG